MRKQLIFLSLILLSYLYSNTIQEIIISGNDTTQDSIILDLISHSPGDTIIIQHAIEDQAALFNSGLFYDAIIYPDSSTYYIFVFEKPKILVNPEADKNDILGWSYGGSVLLNNINGQNKKFKITALAGASTLFDIKYCNPKINHLKDSLNINAYNKFYKNIDNDYEKYTVGIKASIALLTQNPSHQINISNKVEHSKLDWSDGTHENNYSIINSLAYQLYQSNNLLQVKISHVLFHQIYKNYFSLDLENKYYIDFRNNSGARFLIKNKLKINNSKNIPIYHKDYLISENYVRGYDINNIPDESNILNQLLWDNITTLTMQIELPFYNMGSISTDLLFFWDWGYGWNIDESLNNPNQKIRSFGTGIRYDIMGMGSVDVCIGINPYNGNKEIQGIVNFTSF